jgi:outer membrane protein assembly factor BamB
LAVIGLLSAAALAWIWLVADITRAWVNVFTGQTIGLAFLACLAWLAFLSRLPRRSRMKWLALVVGSVALAGLLLRIDHVSGDLVPQFRWRFAAKPHEKLAARAPSAPESATQKPQIDLTATTRDYPQFLGKHRDGMLQGVRLARDWEAQPPRQVWRQPIGAGWSSFAAVGDYLFTQEQRGPQELVVCYELATGHMCWSHADEAYFATKIGGDGPRATPTVDSGRVYTMGATGLLNCLDGATGQPIWPTRDVLKDSSPSLADWGKACSPLVLEDIVVITGGADKGPSLWAYDKQTGELAWKADDAPTGHKSYSSPMLAELCGVRQIVILNDNSVAGHNPKTGHQLWQHDWPGPEPKVTQPLILPGDRLFVASGYGVGSALLQLQTGENGKLRVTQLWANRNLKPKFTNVVHRDGYVYGLDEGILTCLDLETGERRWKEKEGRFNHGQILLVDDLILVQAESGEVVLVAASPQALEVLGRFPALTSKTWNHMALAPPYLLVRNDQEAACFELPLER